MTQRLDLHTPGHDASSPQSPAAVELRGVTKRFGKTLALDNFSLAARDGEFLTLLGPSGCGKTTALRLISGLESPDSGAVLLTGHEVTGLPPHRREVNQVFQSYALFPHLSVFDNVAFGLRMKRVNTGEIRARAGRALSLVSLDGLETRRPAQLSGGQRQRVALARALVCEPRVLLLDEPLSALDARLRAQVREELRALQRRLGLTFILVTHDQEEALAVSDRVAVINRGKIEQLDTVENIYHRPASRFVAGFIGEANLWEAVVLEQAEGFCRCRLAGGSGDVVVSAVPSPAKVGVGDKIVLMIRPENVQVQTPDGWPATVRERVFQGAAMMLTLHAANGIIVRALHPASAGAAPDVGTPVHVRIDVRKCLLLPPVEAAMPDRVASR